MTPVVVAAMPTIAAALGISPEKQDRQDRRDHWNRRGERCTACGAKRRSIQFLDPRDQVSGPLPLDHL
jgi:hypothetical protein